MFERPKHPFLEVEFIAWLKILIDAHPDFGPVLSGLVDISKLHTTNMLDFDLAFVLKGTIYAADVKIVAPLTAERVKRMIEQLRSYQAYSKLVSSLVAIVPDFVQPQYLTMFAEANILLWDASALADIFRDQLHLIQGTPLYLILVDASMAAKAANVVEDQLVERLGKIPAGRERYWLQYQKVCSDIFARLFSPPLSKPILERPDESGSNRRDIIMPNYAEGNFWLFMRQEYRAFYIVIDAKNLKSEVPKDAVLQMANYLREFGVGLFGLICCRTKADRSASVTCREQWIAYRKLILFLNDQDLIQMLTLKKNGQNAEDVLKQKIEDFRLGV